MHNPRDENVLREFDPIKKYGLQNFPFFLLPKKVRCWLKSFSKWHFYIGKKRLTS
jgi:hypothetical protein